MLGKHIGILIEQLLFKKKYAKILKYVRSS